MKRRQADVIIVGAGAAGLSAARLMSQAGVRTAILEARDRLGGRIRTLHDPLSPLPVELGAEFVHGEPAETLAIVRAASLNLDRLPDGHYRSHLGKLSRIEDFWGAVGDLRREIAKTMNRATRDFSLTEYFKRKKLNSQSHQLLVNYAEGYNAANADEISARSMGLEEQEDTKQFRLVGGYDGVIEWLRAGLESDRTEIRLNTVAREIHWHRGQVTVHCESRAGATLAPFRARFAIVTIPAALLRTKAVRFVPDLPAKERALERLQSGQVFKAVLRFRKPLWQDNTYLAEHGFKKNWGVGINFVHADEQEAIPIWWTRLPSQAPILTAWAGGPKAEALLVESEEVRLGKVIDGMTRVFGVSRALVHETLESWSSHDWRNDPFSCAAYTYVGVGGFSAANVLARPVQDTLFFAGEATDLDEMGTVAGALRSGQKAARQIRTKINDGDRRDY